MKDLLVLIFLIIFIVIAHSWKNPEKKSTDKKAQVEAGNSLTEVESEVVTRTEMTFGVSTVFNSGNETSQLKGVGELSGHFTKPAKKSGSCPVHRYHDQQMSFLCPYYDYTIIPLNPQNSARQAGFLLQY